jgi:3-dehydroquinate synthase
MAKIQRIIVKSTGGAYPVVCGYGVLRRLGTEIRRLGKFSSVHVVTSPKVWDAVKKKVILGLGGTGFRLHVFDDRETAKHLPTVESICRNLIRAGADRHAVVVAVGGGVVGDVAGFAAASYLRGVSLVQVPTTVVAQTDSAIGGKTGVNLPEGKNLVGAFFPPKLVLADPDVLSSLPEREFRGGLAEVIKYGVIADAKLFRYLEKHFDKLLARNRAAVQTVIRRSIEIKGMVVGKDEREAGLREILNFGHTFGHALESATAYKRYQHGEAVALGMIAAALYGYEAGITPAADAAKIVALVRRLGRPPAWPSLLPARFIHLMRSDKKSRAGQLRFVLTPRIGRAATYEASDLKKVELILRLTPYAAHAESLVWHV